MAGLLNSTIHSLYKNEDVVREISRRKDEPEWLTEWWVKAYHHWTTLEHPERVRKYLSSNARC